MFALKCTTLIFLTFFSPACKTYLCDFHREQAWARWVKKTENGVSHIKDQVLSKLRKIAHAGTLKLFNQAVNDLKKSALWKADHAKLKQWFENTWLGIKEVFSIRYCNIMHDYSMCIYCSGGLRGGLTWKQSGTYRLWGVVPDQ